MRLPQGFSAITPYLFVDNAADYIDFLMQAFNANELGRTVRDERIVNCLLSVNDAMLFVSESTAEHPAMTTAIYLYVDNVEDSFKQAIEAGCKIETQISDMPFGDRLGGVRDPSGNIWWVSQHML